MRLRACLLLLILNPSVWAQSDPDGSDTVELDRIFVTGNMQEKLQNFTAPDEVSKKELQTRKQTDVMRALKAVSGVYVREEDGQGLRPNIGLRGTHPDRSKKIVLMEDDVLISPAPYSAPAAYYTPSMQSTESLQVYKGFASVPWGPNSIGGSINYITKQIPKNGYQKIDGSYGGFNTRILNLEAGDSVLEKFGFLLNASRIETDGFKTLPGGQNTGFVKNDFLLKGSWNLSPQQYLKTKFGFSTENSHETYLGVSQQDFDNNAYRRYASSALDDMQWTHRSFQLEHGVQVGKNTFIKTTAYYNQFDRTWFRVDSFGNSSVSIRDVLNNPTGSNAYYYQILKGQLNSSSLGTDGNIILANNNRQFWSGGLQTNLTINSDWGATKNELISGARLHGDAIQRNHTLHTAQMSNGAINLDGQVRQGQLDKNQAIAATAFVENNLTLGDWKWTVVGRYENIRFTDNNKMLNTTNQTRDHFFVPGTGLSYKITPTLAARASINRALNVAGLSSFGRNERERATNYEVGLRYGGTQFNSDMTFFYNNYDNITGSCSDSGGCLADNNMQFNGGAARVFGLEWSANTRQHYRSLHFPIQASLTLMSAEFASTFQSSSPEWGIGTISSGSRLPYIPKVEYNVNIGVDYKKWQNNLSFTYQSDVVDQSLAKNQIRVGGFGIVDIVSRYNYSQKGSLYIKADNLLAVDYVVAARPFGFRPGKPQMFGFGITQTF